VVVSDPKGRDWKSYKLPSAITQHVHEAPPLRCGKAEHGGLTPGIGALVSKIPLGGLVHRADDTTDRPTDAGCKSERGVPDSSLERLSA